MEGKGLFQVQNLGNFATVFLHEKVQRRVFIIFTQFLSLLSLIFRPFLLGSETQEDIHMS